MIDYSCESCEELRQDAPNFVVNGLGDTEVSSLKNNTGLNPSSGNDDCEDLNNMNDCLVGNMKSEIDSYTVCNWKDYMKALVDNLWTMFKGIISAICGLWTQLSELWEQLMLVSYVGIYTMYVDSNKVNSSGTQKKQILAFDSSVRQGNMPSTVLNANSGMTGIVVSNTTEAPLLIEATINVSLRTTQHMASCFLTVVRDGTTIGQTPFITPATYDQQCEAEAFILDPGESTTLTYYFGIGDANSESWFQNLFYTSGGSEDAKLCLEVDNPSNPENQRSYFTVRATSIVSTSN